MTVSYKLGDRNDYISKIQRALNEIVYSGLKTDGFFGQQTKDSLQDWQIYFGIEPDGIYAGRTAEILNKYIYDRFLAEQDYKIAAIKLNVTEPIVRAVTEVEAKGYGFLQSGRSTILYERHIFFRYFSRKLKGRPGLIKSIKKTLQIQDAPENSDEFINYLHQKYPLIINPTPGGYQGTVKGIEHEYNKIEFACKIDDECGLYSVSYGLFQIMGFNYKAAGFNSVNDMYISCARSERNQLDAFCNFVLNDRRLISALRTKNMLQFALAYNGPAQKGYDKKLEEALRKWENILK